MDKLRSMEVLVTVADSGSFAAAARQLDLSAVMVGKHVHQLEQMLGARLVERSTRRQSLTDVGLRYVDECRRVLEGVRWAEAVVEHSRAAPAGLLRISAPVTYGHHVVAPLLAAYLQRYRAVRADLQLTDSVVDLVGEGVDVAVRIGDVVNDNLIARPLRPYRMVIAAAPQYLRDRGTPQRAQDLAQHDCLSHAVWQRRSEWTLQEGHETVAWPADARLVCNQGEGLRSAALLGLGLVMQPEVLLADDLAAGRLVPVLEHCLPPQRAVNIVYTPDRWRLPKLVQFVEMATRSLGPAATAG